MKKSLFLAIVFLALSAWAFPGTADAGNVLRSAPADDADKNGRPGRPRPHQPPNHYQRKPRKPAVIIQVPPQVQIQTRTLSAGALSGEFPAVVLKVLDGDSLIVRDSNYKDIEVRLYGIDCPEGSQPGGVEAAAFVRSFQGRQVTIREMDTDSYGRMVALVSFEGRSVNLDLAVLGHAWHYAHYCRSQPICGQIKTAEAEARAAGRGLWSGRNPVAPWEWRRSK